MEQFLIYEEMRKKKYLAIYEKAISHNMTL